VHDNVGVAQKTQLNAPHDCMQQTTLLSRVRQAEVLSVTKVMPRPVGLHPLEKFKTASVMVADTSCTLL
jgi:hypothetical protein